MRRPLYLPLGHFTSDSLPVVERLSPPREPPSKDSASNTHEDREAIFCTAPGHRARIVNPGEQCELAEYIEQR